MSTPEIRIEPVEVAYYYPQPYWRMAEADWLKGLLLFFDRIAILLPRYMYGREVAADPVLAGPMRERGLLQVLEPETFVDKAMAKDLADALTQLISDRAFDDLDMSAYYQELSRSRMGWDADVDLAKGVIKELKRRGLAKKSQDGVSVPLHPVVRTTVLVLLSQRARSRGRELGLELHPVTGEREVMTGLSTVLSLPSMPSAGQIVTLDLETVGVDLASVPLDEVLSFREAHGTEYRAYARDLRGTIAELSQLEPEERERRLLDRRDELSSRADDLRQTSIRAWRQPLASISLGAAGAAWAVAHGDVVPAALSLAAGVVGASFSKVDAGAYSYLFRVRDTLSSGS
jgi:hypothetical protein